MKIKHLIILSSLLVYSIGYKNSLKFIIPEETCFEYEESYNDENVYVNSFADYDFKAYFQNLYLYSPYNQFGTCGYVSLIQYLSFLDNFINDNIIPENYDKFDLNNATFNDLFYNSPGIERHYYNASFSYELVQSNKENDFQLNLIDILNSKKNTPINEWKYSIGLWDYFYILEELYDDLNLSFNYVTASNFSLNSIPTNQTVINGFDQYTKSSIDNGIPVILHISQFNPFGIKPEDRYLNPHSVLAYDYDENGIYANYGYYSNTTHKLIEDGYTIYAAGSFDFSNLEVVHSNNYVLNSAYYCGCGNHTHISDEFIYFDTRRHLGNCACGTNLYRSHVVSSADSSRYKECLDCHTILDMNVCFAIIRYE